MLVVGLVHLENGAGVMKMEGETVYLIACLCNVPVMLLRTTGTLLCIL